MQCACVEIPELRLQIITRREQTDTSVPLAVIEEDRPAAQVLELNAAARDAGLRTGLSYTLAQSLLPELHAHTVTDTEIAHCRSDIRDRLYAFSPGVEAWERIQGVFWLDTQGTGRLWSSPQAWASEVYSALDACGYSARITLGFSRFGTYVLARTMKERAGIRAVNTADEEQRAVDHAPVTCLPLSLRSRKRLRKLGITSMHAFLSLPAPDVSARFDRSARELHSFACKETPVPVQNHVPEVPVTTRIHLPDLTNSEQVMRFLEDPLQQLVLSVMNRGLLVRSVELTLHDEHDGRHHTELIPSAPSCDVKMLIKLIRMRLEADRIGSRLEQADMLLQTVRSDSRTQDLFDKGAEPGTKRAVAFALIRAEFGNASVRRIALQDSHLPEEKFAFFDAHNATDIPVLAYGYVDQSAAGPVRRVFLEPVPCDPRELFSSADILLGPVRYAPRWWIGGSGRTYYILGHGEIPEYWCFTDGPSWWLQGLVQ